MELQKLGEHAPPATRREERQQAFDHQYEGQCSPEGRTVHAARWRYEAWLFDYFLAGAGTAPLPRNILKKSEEAGSSTITSLFLLKLAL